MNRIVSAIFILIFLCGGLTACYDRREIEDMTYVMALGLDKGKTQPLKLTLQYVIPKELGGGNGGGGGGGDGGGAKALQSITVESPSLYAGLNMANNSVGKQINLSHAKVMVFSEELAKEGVGKYIHGAARGREFRPNMFVAVSRTSAEDYLKEIKPVQEIDPSKYYELNYSSFQYTGFFAISQFYNFYTEMVSNSWQPVTALVGVGKFKSADDFNLKNSTFMEKGRTQPEEGDYKAGDIPKTGDIKSEIMGLGVYDGDKLVGEMDGEESTDYLMVTGEYNHSYLTIPDPMVNSKVIVLDVKQSRKPVRKVDISSGKPNINVTIKLEADIIAIQSSINYEAPDKVGIVENAASDTLKKNVIRFLNRTSNEFKSDICGFGKSVKGKFLTWEEWKNYNWLDKYKDSNFNVNLELKIRRPGLMVRTAPINYSEGSESGQ